MAKGKFLIAAIAIAFLISACADKMAVAWRTTAATRIAAEATDKTLAMVHKQKRELCKKNSQSHEEYVTCVLTSRQHEALSVWRMYARPAINSALTTTVSVLTLAEKTDKDVNWVSFLKPAICTLSIVVEKWGHLFPKAHQDSVKALLKMIKVTSCDD